MSREYLKVLDDVYYTLSNKLTCLVASNLNININFDHKLNEIHSSISNEHSDELNLKLLGQRLSELHTMLDMKMKCIEEVNLMCSKQNKAYLDFNNDQTEVMNNSQHLSDTYSEIESPNCEPIQPKFKSSELGFPSLKTYDSKNPPLPNRSDSVSSKKLSSSRYSDDSIPNPASSGRANDCGPLLRKKLNFKPNKHKAKKFIPFKKQAFFKNTKDGNLAKKTSSNIRLSSSDAKYSSFSKKRKRLSLSSSLLHNSRTRNNCQLNKATGGGGGGGGGGAGGSGGGGGGAWGDHEDSRVYCICNKPSYGDMIACDSERCKIEWFHYKCVDITTSPKGDWFCPMCKVE